MIKTDQSCKISQYVHKIRGQHWKRLIYRRREEWPCHHSSVQFYFYPPRGHITDINKHWKLLALWYMHTNKSIQNYTSLKMYNNTEKKISIWQTLFEFVSCDLQKPIREHTKKLQVTWLTYHSKNAARGGCTFEGKASILSVCLWQWASRRGGSSWQSTWFSGRSRSVTDWIL